MSYNYKNCPICEGIKYYSVFIIDRSIITDFPILQTRHLEYYEELNVKLESGKEVKYNSVYRIETDKIFFNIIKLTENKFDYSKIKLEYRIKCKSCFDLTNSKRAEEYAEKIY